MEGTTEQIEAMYLAMEELETINNIDKEHIEIMSDILLDKNLECENLEMTIYLLLRGIIKHPFKTYRIAKKYIKRFKDVM